MVTVGENDLAEAARNQLRVIRSRDDGDLDALDGLRWLLVNMTPSVGTDGISTVRQALTERAAVQLAIRRLVVAIEEGARGATIDGLWDEALEAAQAWTHATRTRN